MESDKLKSALYIINAFCFRLTYAPSLIPFLYTFLFILMNYVSEFVCFSILTLKYLCNYNYTRLHSKINKEQFRCVMFPVVYLIPSTLKSSFLGKTNSLFIFLLNCHQFKPLPNALFGCFSIGRLSKVARRSNHTLTL